MNRITIEKENGKKILILFSIIISYMAEKFLGLNLNSPDSFIKNTEKEYENRYKTLIDELYEKWTIK